MKLKLLATSLNATFENFVTSIENHEAVAASMIKDISRAAARLRVQDNRVQAQINDLQRAQKTLQTQADCWQTRAQTRSVVNPEQALQCLQQRDATRTRLERVSAELAESLEVKHQLEHSLQQIEARLGELRNRRRALASKEACNLAQARTSEDDSQTDIDALFDRWEEAVVSQQYNNQPQATYLKSNFGNSGDCTSELGTNQFAREIHKQEQDERLLNELEALQAKQSAEDGVGKDDSTS